MTQQENHGINILALGRSGVGKSSLLNYLLGYEHYKTGCGRPVTKLGFHVEKSHIFDQPVTLIDSAGLESGPNFKPGLDCLMTELKKHDPSSHPMEEWLHVILYCINAVSARVEPVDREIINMLREKGHGVIVVITHADYDEETCKQMIENVMKVCPSVRKDDFIEICSITDEKRGIFPQEYSKRSLRQMMLEQSEQNIFNLCPDYCIRRAKEVIEKFQKDIKQEITDMDCSFWDDKAPYEEQYKKKCEAFRIKLQDEIFPGIVRDSVENGANIVRSLRRICGSRPPVDPFTGTFKPVPVEPLWEDDDPLWIKAGTVCGMIACVVPVIIFGIVKGADIIKDDLKKGVDGFCKELVSEVEKKKANLDDYFHSLVSPNIVTRLWRWIQGQIS